MKNKRIIILSSILMLASCASEPKYTWSKNGVEGQGKEYIIADSLCTAESYKASPAPNTSGCNDGGSISQGGCTGLQIRHAREVRTKVYDGCMLEKGWDKNPVQEQSLVDSFLKK